MLSIDVFPDSKRHFLDEDLRLFVPSCRLLLALAMGSDHACCAVVGQTVPLLEDLYNKFTGVSDNQTVITLMFVINAFSSIFMNQRVIALRNVNLLETLLAVNDKNSVIIRIIKCIVICKCSVIYYFE